MRKTEVLVRVALGLYTVSTITGKLALRKGIYNHVLGGICVGTYVAGTIVTFAGCIMSFREEF